MEQRSGKTLSASVRQTLTVVRSLLSGPGGVEAALRLLERRVQEQVELSQSAAIWACISSLREQRNENKDGVREVSDRANMLRMAPVRVLMFDDMMESSSSSVRRKVSNSNNRHRCTRTKLNYLSSVRRNFNIDDDDDDVQDRGESFVVEKHAAAAADDDERTLNESRRLGRRCNYLLEASADNNYIKRDSKAHLFDVDGRNGKSRSELYLERSARIGKCTATLLASARASERQM